MFIFNLFIKYKLTLIITKLTKLTKITKITKISK